MNIRVINGCLKYKGEYRNAGHVIDDMPEGVAERLIELGKAEEVGPEVIKPGTEVLSSGDVDEILDSIIEQPKGEKPVKPGKKKGKN